jgi:esterase/lipase
MAATTATILLSLYLLLLVGMYLNQRNLLFAGRRREPALPADARPITLQNGAVALRGYAVNPDRADAVVYFCGNREHAADHIGRLRDAVPHATSYAFDYRGYGHSEGSPTETDLFADALRIYDWVAAAHARVYVVGRSLGSGIAIYVAAHRPVQKLLLVTPYDSVARVAAAHYPLLPVRFLLKDRFESWRYAPAVNAETLVVKAGVDHVVPHHHTDVLLRAFQATAPGLRVLANTRHHDIVETPEFSATLRDFLRL